MTAPAAIRPGTDEYGPFYAGYIDRVPPGAYIVELLEQQQQETLARLRAIPDSRGAHRYAPGKWSVRQLILHLADTERIMAYRALRIGRADATPLPGFDESTYAPVSGADDRTIADLAGELADVRQASLALFRHLPAAAWGRKGTASGFGVSVRGLAWIIAGHERHHLAVLTERYGV
jgi:hypothetical protein